MVAAAAGPLVVVGCPAAPSRHIPWGSSSSLSPWRPDSASLRCRPPAASRRTLLQQLAVCAAMRPSRLAAATFQAPSVSFLPPSSSRAAHSGEARMAAAPVQHSGPPVFVQATGRIIASACAVPHCWLPSWVPECGQLAVDACHRILACLPARGPCQGLLNLRLLPPCCPPHAVGDIHGDLQKALSCLEMAGVLAEDDGHIKWVGGDTVVVQLGDVLDRGDCEIGELPLPAGCPALGFSIAHCQAFCSCCQFAACAVGRSC